MFSAVTSAFIIDVNTQLQPDPNEETAALLRLLIYNMNKTAFGGTVPTVPQWSGPPRTIVRVQAMLYASLAASLLSAFLAMLGKQWLNRYASSDMRGTAIERSQNRQRKFDGIVIWYFNHVLEALPLMLQFALLLLGCALSLYIWGIDTTVASVVIGVASFGVISYTFITAAGAVSTSCPYQTPGAQILRYLWQKVPNHSAFFVINHFVAQEPGAHPLPEEGLDREVAVLDFPCILWVLRTSLDRGINQSTLKYLASVLVSPGFKTIAVADCFNVFTSSVSVTNNNQVVVLRGSEQLAEIAATCLLGALSHSFIVDPESNILKDVRQQYNRVFPHEVGVRSLPFCHIINGIHKLFHRHDHLEDLSWEGVDLFAPENFSLAHNLTKVAWLCCQQSWGQEGVPRWVLHFSLHYLLQVAELPVSVITDCFLIIAIYMGCDVSNFDIKSLDKRCVCLSQLQKLSS